MASTSVKTEPKDFKDIDQICRLCLSEESLGYIFDEQDLQKWISDYLSITVSPDEPISTVICAICRIRLAEFHQFRIRCQEVQTVLNSMGWDENPEDKAEEQDETSSSDEDDSQDVKTEIGDVKVEAQEQEVIAEDELPTIKLQLQLQLPSGNKDLIDIEDVKIEIRKDDDSEATLTADETSCSEQLIADESRADHIQDENNQPRKVHTCHTCNVNFSAGFMLNRHCRGPKHMEKLFRTSGTQLEPTKNVEKKRATQAKTKQVKVYRCHTCNMDFYKARRLARHCLTQRHIEKTSASQDQPAKNVEDDEPIGDRKQERRDNPARPYKCDKCPKRFKTPNTVRTHMQQKHGSQSLECNDCGYKFTNRLSWSRHLKKKTCSIEERLNLLQQTETNKSSNISSKSTDVLGDIHKSNTESKQITAATMQPNPNDASFHCTKCDKKFAVQWHLIHHYRLTHGKIYKCHLCNDSFALKKTFEKHLSLKHTRPDGSSKPLTCDKCNKVFESSHKLSIHKKYHRIKMLKSCTVCNKMFKSSAHRDSHETTCRQSGPKLFQCEQCDKKFATLDKKTAHMQGVHGPKNHKCKICSTDFAFRSSLLQHMRRFHSEQWDSLEQNIISEKPVKRKKEIHPCQVCNLNFPSTHRLDRHLSTKVHAEKVLIESANQEHHAKKPQQQEPTTAGGSQKDYWKKTKHLPRPFKCKLCEKAFMNSATLFSHMVCVHGPRRHKCHICGAAFTMRSTLKKHWQRKACMIEEGSNQLERMSPNESSSIADKSTDGSEENSKSNTDLPQNPRSSMEEQFSCSKCDRIFPNQWHLLTHFKFAHKKIYKCTLCIKSFAVQKWLDMHITATHKRPDGTSKQSKLPSCDKCNKVFPTRRKLMLHERYHRTKHLKYCAICNKWFRTRHLRLSHESSCGKLADQPLTCEKCDKKFSTAKQKLMHMRIHGPKNHKCKVCSKAFAYRASLVKHLRTHNEPEDSNEQNVESGNGQPSSSRDSDGKAEIAVLENIKKEVLNTE